MPVKKKPVRRKRDEDEDEKPRRTVRKKPESRRSSSRKPAKDSKPKTKKGLTAKTFRGLNEKRMAAASGGQYNDRIFISKGKSVTVQFMGNPDSKSEGFMEYDCHSWKEGQGFKYVPCTGDDCPLCEDEDREISRAKYRFACQAYDHDRKRMGVIEGPNSLSTRLVARFKSDPKKFLRRTWDISKLDVSGAAQFDVAVAGKPAKQNLGTPIDLDKWIQKELDAYYGADGSGVASGRTSLDDDDDEDADDDIFTRSELRDMTTKELRKIARGLNIDTEDMSKKELITEILEEQE